MEQTVGRRADRGKIARKGGLEQAEEQAGEKAGAVEQAEKQAVRSKADREAGRGQ